MGSKTPLHLVVHDRLLAKCPATVIHPDDTKAPLTLCKDKICCSLVFTVKIEHCSSTVKIAIAPPQTAIITLLDC